MLAKRLSSSGLGVLAATAVLLSAGVGPAALPRGQFHMAVRAGAAGFYHGGVRHIPGVGGTLNRGNYYDPYGYGRRASFNIGLYGRAMSRVPPYALGYGSYYPYYGSYSYGGYPVYPQSYGGYDPYDTEPIWGLVPPAKPVLTPEEKDVRSLLTASGVPIDEGRLVWPLALRALPGPEAPALRGQIDALLEVASTQAARGQPNPAVVEELDRATDRLRKVLVRHREERGGLAEASYQDAERFLDKLDGARTLLRVKLAPAAGEGRGANMAPDYRP